MDHKKFEKLIDLIINENEEQARELFHDIVVEKSREIYESIMEEEMMDDMEEGMGGQVGDLLDEINVDEAGGMYEDESDDDLDDMLDGDDEETEIIDIDDEGDAEDHEEVEDAVIRIEDKLDRLMAEFEDIMGGAEEEEGEEEEEEGEGEEEAGAEEEEEGMEEMMENVQLQKVSVTHGDNGVQKRSTVDANSGQAGMASRPVKFSGYTEANPTGPKQPHDYLTKGEGQVKGAGSFKNAPGQKSQDLSSAPKAVTKDAATGTRSPVAESRKRR
jgi:hypothetical protein